MAPRKWSTALIKRRCAPIGWVIRKVTVAGTTKERRKSRKGLW
jgi:hypothetical protein